MNPALHELATKGGAVVAGGVVGIAAALAGQSMGLHDNLLIGVLLGGVGVGLVGGYVLIGKVLGGPPRPGDAAGWPADASPDAKRLFPGPKEAILAMLQASKVFALSEGLPATDINVAATQRALGLYTAILPALSLRPEEIAARKGIYLDLATLLCMDVEDHWHILKVSSRLPSTLREFAQKLEDSGDPELNTAGLALSDKLP